ncbi:hypothetical protein Trydic_g23143, partial [Trypoxylus dichotomus]
LWHAFIPYHFTIEPHLSIPTSSAPFASTSLRPVSPLDRSALLGTAQLRYPIASPSSIAYCSALFNSPSTPPFFTTHSLRPVSPPDRSARFLSPSHRSAPFFFTSTSLRPVSPPDRSTRFFHLRIAPPSFTSGSLRPVRPPYLAARLQLRTSPPYRSVRFHVPLTPPFRPYTQFRRSICTSESQRTSIRVSPDFVLTRHSSPSFWSQRVRSWCASSRNENETPREGGTISKDRPSSLGSRKGAVRERDRQQPDGSGCGARSALRIFRPHLRSAGRELYARPLAMNIPSVCRRSGLRDFVRAKTRTDFDASLRPAPNGSRRPTGGEVHAFGRGRNGYGAVSANADSHSLPTRRGYPGRAESPRSTFRFFSTFPHGTCSLSVSWSYLALDGVYHPLRAALSSNPTLRRDPPAIDGGQLRAWHPLWVSGPIQEGLGLAERSQDGGSSLTPHFPASVNRPRDSALGSSLFARRY